MRTLLIAASLLVTALPVAAQGHVHPAPTGGGQLAAGWKGRTDRDTDQLSNVMFMEMGKGFHVKTGPAAILWNPAHQASGKFVVAATFTATGQPPREAYGIVYGGKNLDRPELDYGYFIIRGDGSYMIRHRAGTELHTVKEWTKSAAIKGPDASGKLSNTLAFDAREDGVHFLINGTEVASFGPEWQAGGLVGLRVNHNLDVQVTDFGITRK